jgi:RNA polymerase sigma-70 factor (ECF subfamily)
VTPARDAQQDDPDVLLVARVGEGDADAYRELLAQHAPRLRQNAFRLLRDGAEADDVMQETWLRVWLKAREYRGEARVTSWLHRMVHNLAVDRLRARGRWDDASDEEPEAPISTRQPALLDAKREVESLQQALAGLPERQAAALTLVHLHGLSAAEAQAILGVSEDALESLLARGRRRLKAALSSSLATKEQSDDAS